MKLCNARQLRPRRSPRYRDVTGAPTRTSRACCSSTDFLRSLTCGSRLLQPRLRSLSSLIQLHSPMPRSASPRLPSNSPMQTARRDRSMSSRARPSYSSGIIPSVRSYASTTTAKCEHADATSKCHEGRRCMAHDQFRCCGQARSLGWCGCEAAHRQHWRKAERLLARSFR